MNFDLEIKDVFFTCFIILAQGHLAVRHRDSAIFTLNKDDSFDVRV